MDAPRALLQTADVVIERRQPKKDGVLAVEPEYDILVSSSCISLRSALDVICAFICSRS